MALRIFPQRKSGLWDPLGHETGTGGKLFNGIRVALPGALSPYLAPLGLVLGFSQATGACFSATRFTRRLVPRCFLNGHFHPVIACVWMEVPI